MSSLNVMLEIKFYYTSFPHSQLPLTFVRNRCIAVSMAMAKVLRMSTDAQKA